MDHLVHYAIGNDYAASEYARLHAPDFLDDLTSLADEVVDEGLIEKALHRMGEGLGSEWEELDGYRRFLLEDVYKRQLSNIAMISGNLGKPGGGVNPLRGQNNVQGACDMGAGPDDLPGYQKVADPEVVRLSLIHI